ncbi:MAG: DUF4388 domain-containing protein [Cyanobacteria bacterium SZAS LIN-5]|nr:DUF4388 domain-containing protein [Cyanobacteria bacterium SZAS LIN-5]RTL44578.1 MAG: DUF4388 domain-containing protein [Candidatus Melainabacteria bacterium]
MLQNFHHSSQPRNIKLEKQSGLPSVKLLEEMMKKSMMTAGALVELPFGDDAQAFNLTVKREQGSWLWMLYHDDGFNSGLEWSHVTHSADQIYTLISNSNLGFMMSKPAQKALPTSTQQQNAAAPADTGSVFKARQGSLQGNLKNIQIGNLFQSINMNQMNGILEIVAPSNKAQVYFVEGNPVHAALRGAEGTEAMIQLQAWEEGEFTFFDERVNVNKTIDRGLIGLLMEGAKYIDHSKYLTQSKLSHESFLIPVNDTDIEQALLANGVECKLSDVIAIYKLIDGAKTWGEILRDIELAKSEWVPVMFNLLSCGLVRISTAPGKMRQNIVENRMDWRTVQSFEQSLCRADSGLYTHPALLYFLAQEWFKYESLQVPFSLLAFGFATKFDTPQLQVPFRSKAIEELREKVFRAKHKYDLLCHFGAFSYAMLLPMSNRKSADRQAETIAEICSTIRVSEDYDPSRIEFRGGIANVPEDCRSLDEVLALVEGGLGFRAT